SPRSGLHSPHRRTGGHDRGRRDRRIPLLLSPKRRQFGMNGPGACRGIVSRVDAVLTSMAIAVLLIAGCANPVPPTDGPADSTPPGSRKPMPADQATRVSAKDRRIEFSEYVDQASVARAFSITPAFAEPVDISWRGRTVTIRFPEPLRPNTTYIVQIDTNLRDA